MLRSLSFIGFVSVTFAARPSLYADLPPLPPEDYEVRSANGQYVAKVTVAPPQITIYPEREGIKASIWSMNEFHRHVFLANDGRHLVIARRSTGAANYSPDVVALRFVAEGRSLRNVTVRELMPDLSKVIRSVSNYHWGRHWGAFPGINSRGEFIVTTVDYRDLYFDVKTGRLLRTEGRYVEWLGYLLDPLRYRAGALIIAAASCVFGVIIGTRFQHRVLFGLVISIVVSIILSIAFLFFPYWAQAGITPVAVSFWDVIASNDFLLAKLSISYVITSGLSVVAVSLLWRGYRRLRSRP